MGHHSIHTTSQTENIPTQMVPFSAWLITITQYLDEYYAGTGVILGLSTEGACMSPKSMTTFPIIKIMLHRIEL